MKATFTAILLALSIVSFAQKDTGNIRFSYDNPYSPPGRNIDIKDSWICMQPPSNSETQSTPWMDSLWAHEEQKTYFFGPANIENIKTVYSGGKYLITSGRYNMIFDANVDGTITGSYNVIAGNICTEYYLKFWGKKDMFWGVDYTVKALKDNPTLTAILKAYEHGFVGTPADTKEARQILLQLVSKSPITRYY